MRRIRSVARIRSFKVSRTGEGDGSCYIVFRNPAKVRYSFVGAWAREGHGLPDELSFRAWLMRTAEELSSPVTVTKGR